MSAFKVTRKKSLLQKLATILVYSLPITWMYLAVELLMDLMDLVGKR